MTEIYLDKSRNVRIRARIGEASVPRTLKFFEEDDNGDLTPHDISGYDFKLFVFKRSNSPQKLFTLAIGDGLEVTGADNNWLQIDVSQERADQKADTYFYRLYSADEDHTWLNGPWEFYHGESDNVEEEETVNIYQNG